MIISHRCVRLNLVCAPQGWKARKKRGTTSLLAISVLQGETKESAGRGPDSEFSGLLPLLDGSGGPGVHAEQSHGTSLAELYSPSTCSTSFSSNQEAYSDSEDTHNLLEGYEGEGRNPLEEAADEESGPSWEELEIVDNCDDPYWLFRPSPADLQVDDKALAYLQDDSDFDLCGSAEGRCHPPYASCEPSFWGQFRDPLDFPGHPDPFCSQVKEDAQAPLQNHLGTKDLVFPPQPSLKEFSKEIDQYPCKPPVDPALMLRQLALGQGLSIQEGIKGHAIAQPSLMRQLGNIYSPTAQGSSGPTNFPTQVSPSVPLLQKPPPPPTSQAWHGHILSPTYTNHQTNTAGLPKFPSEPLRFVGQEKCPPPHPYPNFKFRGLEPIEDNDANPDLIVPKSGVPNAILLRSKTPAGGTQIIINPRWPT